MKLTLNLFNLRTLFVLTFILVGFSTSLWAMNLSEAKQAGLLGEQTNGYLGLVKKPASEEAISLAKEVNSKRKAKYEEIALSKGIELKHVEKQAGIQTITKTEKGNYINLGGGWQKK